MQQSEIATCLLKAFDGYSLMGGRFGDTAAQMAAGAIVATFGWQPIETAPRDGTDILLGCATWDRAELGHWSVETAYWSTDGGSYEDGEKATGPDEVDSPTHWQPLPSNPSP